MLCPRSAQRTLRPENHGQVSLSQVSDICNPANFSVAMYSPNRHIYVVRFEIEIEPIFGSLALYDVKEKKKV